MNPSSAAPVCILGMHRSGTSMIAGALEGFGLHLGSPDQLLGEEPGNPQGHWENLEILGVNEVLLRDLGGSWSSLPERRRGWEESPVWEPYRESARRALESLARPEPWGWKDPRTTVLVPFWRDLVPKVRFVICLRHPLEVARSLEKRDGMPLAAGTELWADYTIAAIRDTAGSSRFFAFYEDFVDASPSRWRGLARFCELPPAVGEQVFVARVVPRLRHHIEGDEEFVAREGLSDRAKLLWVGLLAILRKEGAPASGIPEPGTLAALESLAKTVAGVLDPPGVLALREESELRRARIGELQSALEDRGHERDALVAETEALRRQLEDAARRDDHLRSELTELQTTLRESAALRFVRSFWRLKDRALPPGSRRREGYDRVLRKMKSARPSGSEAAVASTTTADPAPIELREEEVGPAFPAGPLPAPLRRRGGQSPGEALEASDAAFVPPPSVSLVVRTCPGRGGCLEEAVESVLAQTHPDLELVIVEDGGSSSRERLTRLDLPPHVRLVYQELPAVGRCLAGNQGLALARGELIGFLDDDDRLYPEHVATLAAVLDERPDLAGAYAAAERVVTRIESHTPFVGEEIERAVTPRHPFDRQHLWIENLFPIQALLFRRRLFDEYGGFHPELKRLEDWDLWVRYASRRDFAFVDRVTSMYRVPADAGTDASRQAAMDECFPPLRALQGRVPVSLSPGEFRSLLEMMLGDKKYFRAARGVGFIDLDREIAAAPFVSAFFESRPADPGGSVETTPREALDLANRVISHSPRLSRVVRIARRVERHRSLKAVADSCYGAVERFL